MSGEGAAEGGARGGWARARAALVLAHAIAVCLMALPSPEGMSTEALAGDAVKRSALASWEGALARAGVPETVSHRWIVGIAGGLTGLDRAVERWLAPYQRIAGTRQSWQMFSSSSANGFLLEMYVAEGGAEGGAEGWRLIYRSLDSGARWRAGLWEDGRVRGAIFALSSPKQERLWRGLARSAARRAALDFPAAARFRIWRVPVRAPAPERLAEEGRAARTPVGAVVVELEALRGAGGGAGGGGS